MALPAMVNFSLTFRTHYRTDWGQTVAILGNCQELGDGNTICQVNKLTWKGNNVWENIISINMARDNLLSFKLVICDDENKQLRHEETNREVNFNQVANLNETNFELETNWDQPEVRLFPNGISKVTILIRSDYKSEPGDQRTEEMLVLGNCVRLGNGDNLAHNEMNCIQRDPATGNTKWRLKVSLRMMLDEYNQWKLPAAGGGFEPLSLKLAVTRRGGQEIIKEGNVFQPELKNVGGGKNEYELQCTFRGTCWVCISMPTVNGQINRESFLKFFTEMHNWHCHNERIGVDNVKNTYAQCLVPLMKLSGEYNGNTDSTSGGHYKRHDIWGTEPANETNIHVQVYKIRSGIEYVALRVSNGLSEGAVCKRLSKKYHARQGNVYGLFVGAGENQWSGCLQGTHSDPEYKTALIKLAHWVRDQSPTQDVLLQLFRQSAAIVRGRMEASLVSKECDVMHSDWYWFWKKHMEVAACWFVLMMAAWRRLNQLNPTEYPILNNEIFKEKMKEDRAPFRPNFYGREPEPAQLPANQA